jgi:hypothetical protein
MEKYLRDPAPEMRAAAAAGVVRAGGAANLDDLYVCSRTPTRGPRWRRCASWIGSVRQATKLIARLASPQREVQKLAADMLLRAQRRDYFRR